jgi:FkbM family methyltransferase
MPCSFFSGDGEDVLIANLVAETTPQTFLDVGANHPVTNSVTHLLSLRGWTGVAVDPNPSFEPLWNAERPQDRFICAGASSSAGHLDFHEFDPDVLSTFDSQRSRVLRAEDVARFVRTTSVPIVTLEAIVKSDERFQGGVGLISIDVEGHECAVLEGMCWERFRPEILCVEISGLIKHGGVFATPAFQFVSNHGYIMKAVTNSSFIFVDRLVDRFLAAGALPFGPQ